MVPLPLPSGTLKSTRLSLGMIEVESWTKKRRTTAPKIRTRIMYRWQRLKFESLESSAWGWPWGDVSDTGISLIWNLELLGNLWNGVGTVCAAWPTRCRWAGLNSPHKEDVWESWCDLWCKEELELSCPSGIADSLRFFKFSTLSGVSMRFAGIFVKKRWYTYHLI